MNKDNINSFALTCWEFFNIGYFSTSAKTPTADNTWGMTSLKHNMTLTETQRLS